MRIRISRLIDELEGKPQEIIEKDEIAIKSPHGNFKITQNQQGDLIITKYSSKDLDLEIKPTATNQIRIR